MSIANGVVCNLNLLRMWTGFMHLNVIASICLHKKEISNHSLHKTKRNILRLCFYCRCFI